MKSSFTKSLSMILNCSLVVALLFSTLAINTVDANALNLSSIAPFDENANTEGWTTKKIGALSSSCGGLIFSDDFSTDKGWIDQSSGRIYRDTTNQWLILHSTCCRSKHRLHNHALGSILDQATGSRRDYGRLWHRHLLS